jgi:hypothetical protein
MPKIAIDYSTRQVSFYKFVCQNEEITSSYVGSTVDFTKRKCDHKKCCNGDNYKSHNTPIYKTIRDNGGWDNWKMIEIESRLVKDKREAERIEQEWIDKLKSNMNSQKAFRVIPYRIENAEKLNKDKRQYRIENPDKLKEQDRQKYIKHGDKIRENKRQYVIDNADKLKEQRKQYYIENADKVKAKRRQYCIDNADKIKEQKRLSNLKKKASALEVYIEEL